MGHLQALFYGHGRHTSRASSGITIRKQLHRALQIGEEDRDLFPLALERGLRGQDLLGEVLGGIAVR